LAFERAIDILRDRYGNKVKLAKSFRDKIDKWPTINHGDGKALQDLADFLAQCETAMGTLGQLRVLDDSSEQQKIVSKLPRFVQDRWLVKVDSFLYNDDCNSDIYPPFKMFVDFIHKQARVACNPLVERSTDNIGPPNTSKMVKRKENSASAFASMASTDNAQTTSTSVTGFVPKCLKCGQYHYLDTCPSFKQLTLLQSVEFVKTQGLCLGCFRKGHLKKSCRKKKQCQVCQLWHPTLLHDYSRQQSSSVNVDTTVANATSHCVEVNDSTCFSHSLIAPVVLYHADNPLCTSVVYAL
jgi:hypothetical protein